MVVRIIGRWTSAGRNPKISVFHVNSDDTISPFMNAWRALLVSRTAGLTSNTSFAFDPDWKEYDSTSGALINFGSTTPPASFTGTGGTSPVSDATQALIRWKTDAVTRNRQLQGRTFIPGITRDAIVAGNNADAGAWTTTLAPLVSTGTLLIWSRPRFNSEGGLVEPGNTAVVTSASMWSEFAVLRKRRG